MTAANFTTERGNPAGRLVLPSARQIDLSGGGCDAAKPGGGRSGITRHGHSMSAVRPRRLTENGPFARTGD